MEQRKEAAAAALLVLLLNSSKCVWQCLVAQITTTHFRQSCGSAADIVLLSTATQPISRTRNVDGRWIIISGG
jgi:hypothetical protein